MQVAQVRQAGERVGVGRATPARASGGVTTSPRPPPAPRRTARRSARPASASASAPSSSASRRSASRITAWMAATSRARSAAAGSRVSRSSAKPGRALVRLGRSCRTGRCRCRPRRSTSEISSGSSRGDPVGRQVLDLLERGPADHPHDPRLRELLPRALQARERPSERVMLVRSSRDRARNGLLGRAMTTSVRSRTRRDNRPCVGEPIGIEEVRRLGDARATVLPLRQARGGGARSTAAPGPRARRGRRRAPSTCRRSTARRWTASRWSPGPRGRAAGSRRVPRRAPARRAPLAPGDGDPDLHRRGDPRGRRRRGARGAHRRRRTGRVRCGRARSRGATSAAPGEDVRAGELVLCARAAELGPAELGRARQRWAARAALCARAPAGGGAGHRRRAGDARRAAGARADLELQPARARRPGRARGRRGDAAASRCPTTAEATARALARGARRARTWCASRAACRWARTTT